MSLVKVILVAQLTVRVLLCASRPRMQALGFRCYLVHPGASLLLTVPSN